VAITMCRLRKLLSAVTWSVCKGIINVTCDAVFACTVLPCSDVMVPVRQGRSVFDFLFVMLSRISDCAYIFTHLNTFHQNREQSYLTVNNLFLPIKGSNYRLLIVRYSTLKYRATICTEVCACTGSVNVIGPTLYKINSIEGKFYLVMYNMQPCSPIVRARVFRKCVSEEGHILLK